MAFLAVVFVAFLALVAWAPGQVMQLLLMFAWIGGAAMILIPVFQLLGRLL